MPKCGKKTVTTPPEHPEIAYDTNATTTTQINYQSVAKPLSTPDKPLSEVKTEKAKWREILQRRQNAAKVTETKAPGAVNETTNLPPAEMPPEIFIKNFSEDIWSMLHDYVRVAAKELSPMEKLLEWSAEYFYNQLQVRAGKDYKENFMPERKDSTGLTLAAHMALQEDAGFEARAMPEDKYPLQL